MRMLRPVAKEHEYLEASEWIDHDQPSVRALARSLAGGSQADVARRCFEWVRDEVKHSSDHAMGPVTCRASDVLAHKTGYCFAKSHLLAALLRANDLHAGLVHQRLRLSHEASPLVLHGFVAVKLDDFGWYRMDPRGNKPGVEASFDPPVERLAFTPTLAGECDLLEIHATPLGSVVACLTSTKSWRDVPAALPAGL